VTYYNALTTITGDVIKPQRTHKTAKGAVCNFVVMTVHEWGQDQHKEFYTCAAFGKLGAEVDEMIAPGQIVKASGWMRSSDWTDGSGKQNHQLIVKAFEVVTTDVMPEVKRATPNLTGNQKEPAKQPKKRRQYGRHARKSKQPDDFRAVAGEPEFNDSLDSL